MHKGFVGRDVDKEVGQPHSASSCKSGSDYVANVETASAFLLAVVTESECWEQLEARRLGENTRHEGKHYQEYGTGEQNQILSVEHFLVLRRRRDLKLGIA